MTKYSDCKNQWFEMWYGDCKNMLHIMYKNMASDLDNGYNPLGNSIKAQKQSIAVYEKYINDTLDKFSEMNDDSKIDRYCYHELIKKGVIE